MPNAIESGLPAWERALYSPALLLQTNRNLLVNRPVSWSSLRLHYNISTIDLHAVQHEASLYCIAVHYMDHFICTPVPPFRSSSYVIKWVDDTHALIIFTTEELGERCTH